MEASKVLSRRARGIPPSATLAITGRAKSLAAQGVRVCSFAAGEPDFDTPEHIKAAAAKALAEGRTKYAPAAGIPELRQAICDKLLAENGIPYEPGQVVVSTGAKQALFNAFMAICDDGDEVIIPAPYWLSYPEMVAMAGGTSVIVDCPEDNDYKITPARLDAAVTDRTKAFILNSPSNPIGVVYTEEELRELVAVCVRRDILVISDEVYEKMVYDGVRHASPASFSDEVRGRTITINGFSKTHAMTGWRLGYLAAPGPIAKAASAIQSHATSGATTFAQYGAVSALRDPQDHVARMVAAFDERRAFLYERLTSIPGLSCVKPQGAFYMLPRIDATGVDAQTFATRLLDEHAVAVVPGDAFGAPLNIRLSYACGLDELREGVDRLATFVASL